jgi:hypothetical protein
MPALLSGCYAYINCIPRRSGTVKLIDYGGMTLIAEVEVLSLQCLASTLPASARRMMLA